MLNTAIKVMNTVTPIPVLTVVFPQKEYASIYSSESLTKHIIGFNVIQNYCMVRM